MAVLVSKEHLSDYILRPENKEVLEDTLYWNSQEYSRIQQSRATAPADRKLDQRGVVNLYHEVTQDIRDLLGLTNSQVGRVDLAIFNWRHYAKHGTKVGGVLGSVGLALAGYAEGISPDMVAKAVAFGVGMVPLSVLYNYTEFQMLQSMPSKRLVAVADKKETRVVDTIAEGYGSHILYDKTDFISQDASYGHILGVRRAIAETVAERRGNETFVYRPLKELTGALKDAYLFVCKADGAEPKASLLRIDVPTTPPNYITPLRFGPMHTRWVLPTNIAAAVFAVAEQKTGRNIYGQMVREDLSFFR